MPSDVRTIANRIHALAEAIDAGDLAQVAALFGEATFVLAGGEPRVGGDAFARTIERSMRRYEDGRPSTLHQVTNLAVTIAADGGTATADSSITVYQARPGFALQPILVGRYHDTFRRDPSAPGSWAWAERAMTIDLVGDTSHHTTNRLG